MSVNAYTHYLHLSIDLVFRKIKQHHYRFLITHYRLYHIHWRTMFYYLELKISWRNDTTKFNPVIIVKNEQIAVIILLNSGVTQRINVITDSITHNNIKIQALIFLFRSLGSVIFSAVNLGHCPFSKR